MRWIGIVPKLGSYLSVDSPLSVLFLFFCRIFGHFDCCELVKSRVENSWSGFVVQKVIRMPSGQRVYIGNIPSDSRERDIERFFKGYGRIREIVIKNGYGFVEFDDYR